MSTQEAITDDKTVWIYKMNECSISCGYYNCDHDKIITTSYAHTSERMAILHAMLIEYSILFETHYLCRRYEEPSPYHKCVARLTKVNWSDQTERNEWLKEHEDILERWEYKVQFIIIKVQMNDNLKFKSKEDEVFDEYHMLFGDDQ